MPDTLRDLVVSLSLQTDNFTRNIRSVNKQIQEAESFFKLAAAGVEDFEHTTQGLTSHLSNLQQKLNLQKEVVDQYSKALQAARDKLSECYTRQEDYAKRLDDAKQKQSDLNDEVRDATQIFDDCKARLGEQDQATQQAAAHLDELKTKYKETSDEVKKLSGQCEALRKATQNAADAVSTGNVNLYRSSAAVKQTEASIDSTNKELQLAQTNWKAAGDSIKLSESAIVSIGKQMSLAEAKFKLATVGIEDVNTSATGLSAKLQLLNNDLQSQTQIVREYESILASAKEQLAAAQQVNDPDKIRQATDAVTDAQTALVNANVALQQTGAAIMECNSQLTLANNGWFTAAESIKGSETAIASIGNQMRLAESSFNLATAGMKDVDTTITGLSAKLTMLQEKLTLQNKAVQEYGNILQQAQTQLAAAQAANDPERIQQATDAVTRAQTALNNANAAIKTTQAEIDQCNGDLTLARTNWLAAGQAMETAQAALGSIDRELSVVDSAFKLATYDIQDIEKSSIGLNAQMDMLVDRWQLQNQAVTQCEAALRAAKEQLAAAQAANDPDKIRQATDAVNDARAALNNAETALGQTEVEIEKTTNNLTLMEQGWYTAGAAADKAKAQIDGIARQLQIAENRFKGSTAGIKNMDTSVSGLTTKLGYLKDKLALQQEAAKRWGDALKAAQEQLKAAQAANDPEKVKQATTAINDAQVALSRVQSDIAQTRAEIDRTSQTLRIAASAWTAMGSACEAAGKRFEATGRVFSQLGRLASTAVTAPVTALGTTAIKASLDFESSFASVRKTVDATEEEFDRLAQSSKRMSTQVAASTSEINEVMATGGQLGIANEHLEEFTRVMIDLGNSCEDLSADEAAASIAKFANVMHTDQSLFQNIGSTIVDLGNNFATTEQPIMQMAQRLAGAGKQVGLTEAQVLGFAAALSSVGIEAQMGGSAFSKALIKMEVACATGGDALEDFAKVSGMTAQEFKKLFESDPATAFQAFIVGLSKMDEAGESAIKTLDDIGIKEVRLRDTLLRSVNATELFARAQDRANKAWEENTALTVEANKRYATTESKLTNLKNKALLFAQQLGDDLNPTIQKLIQGADSLIDKFMNLDEAQRQQIIKWAAIAAAVGPALLVFGKFNTGLGKVVIGIGKFATAVGQAGGGFSGFMSVLGKSPSVWFAVAAAVVVATVAIADYVSGAREAREALKGMAAAAEEWKNTAADTFYGRSEGLSAFGMDKSAFSRATMSAQSWMDGLIAVWTDGEKETDEIVSHWTDSFKQMTASTRTELQELKQAAEEAGYGSVADEISASIDQLDKMDAEIEKLLKKRQNGFLTDDEKVRLQDLIDAREAIEIKYNLTPADVDGFSTIEKKLEAAVARAQAMGKPDADISVYQDAIVAAGEGMAAINAELDAQYDKEYAVIQLIEDAAERQQALDALNAKYNEDRRAAAMEYAETLSNVVTPVWNQESIQQAKDDVADLFTLLRKYSLASENDKPAILTELKNLSTEMDESSLTEYLGLLTQIQSLMDEGLSEAEIQAMFPDIDLSGALDQFAGIASYLDLIKTDLPGLYGMFNEALPEEVLKIATDLDMTGAQARWDEFAANPGAITTDAIVNAYTAAENAEAEQPHVDAFIDKYFETPEGADTAQLTPTGILAYVTSYAEATTGTDVSALTPENITAMVSGYQELASGADVSTLKPSEITAYIMKYLEGEGVDTSALTPEAVTAFVLAYEEINGGASTAALTPDGVTAMVAKYLQAEGVDITALSPDQINGIVSKYSEATGCDKSELLTSLTAYITEYKEAAGVTVPRVQTRVIISGYDFLAYNQLGKDNPDLELEIPVRLGELDPGELEQKLQEGKVKFWKDGVEVPVESVPENVLTADTVASLDTDGTLHILITPELTGTEEAISQLRDEIAEVDQFGTTTLGKAVGMIPTTTMDMVASAMERINKYQQGGFWNWLTGATNHDTLSFSMKSDFSQERVAELSAYVAEIVTAIKNGQEVSEEDMQNLQNIIDFLNGLDTTDTGGHIREGIAQGMVEAGWDTDAETVASDLENALNSAFIIGSPAKRMNPIGEYVAAGIGEGAGQYDFSTDAAAVASALETAISGSLTGISFAESGKAAMTGLANTITGFSLGPAGAAVGTNAVSAVAANLTSFSLRPIGVSAMNGLIAGINAGRSGVISAMRNAARAAVSAAKAELQIHSPSRVFRDEVGSMAMKGFGEGVLQETKAQAKVIRNAARFLTGAAQDGAIAFGSNDNSRTYNNTSTVNLNVSSMNIRDQQDITSLAIEIASLTKRQQRGKGLRLA